jgi:hypothetical protein
LHPVKSAGIIAGMIDLIILIAAGFTIGAVLLALLAIYNAAGMTALWLAVGAIYVIYAALQRRGVGYYDAFSGPALPAPSTRRLQQPGPPQIGRSRRTPLPGPNK